MNTRKAKLQSVVAERASVETDKLFHALVFSPSLKKGRVEERLARIRANFDLSPYLRQYDIEEPSPQWFLDTYIGWKQMKAIAKKMRQDMLRTLAEPGWLPGGRANNGLRKREAAALRRAEADKKAAEANPTSATTTDPVTSCAVDNPT